MRFIVSSDSSSSLLGRIEPEERRAWCEQRHTRRMFHGSEAC
jgi:hypothetical protein